MDNQKLEQVVLDAQNITSRIYGQNFAIKTAISGLSSITHSPMNVILGGENISFTNEDRTKIAEFMNFLISKEVSNYSLTQMILEEAQH